MRLVLNVWRQAQRGAGGGFERYDAPELNPDMSFLEMLDVVNGRLIEAGQDPIAFEHDCREGICGACGMVINGEPHGPVDRVTVCQLHLRSFTDGQELWIEPWRARPFPVIKDLVVDRGSFDRIIEAGGYISVRSGPAPEANSLLVPKENADRAMDAASCIACGACVAACPNASAMLFTASKVAHLALMPQGQPERLTRVVSMVEQMDEEGFGNCTNHGACEAACPKGIRMEVIALLNRDLLKAGLTSRPATAAAEGVG